MGYSQKLKEKILCAPDSPGVYLISDAQSRVLYVGKAKVLKKRLLSYLRPDLNPKTLALMRKARDVQVRLTPSEDMALLLEASLIRELKPKYNVSLRDDKSFPYVRISREDFPAISITRKKDNPAAQYLGPYTDAKLLKNALKIIRSNFAYRTCRRMPKRPCIYYKINLCSHGFTFGYCPKQCIRFSSLKEKIAEDRRLFLRQFKQTPKKLSQLKKRKIWSKMNLETKKTFIQKLIIYRKLEQQAKY